MNLENCGLIFTTTCMLFHFHLTHLMNHLTIPNYGPLEDKPASVRFSNRISCHTNLGDEVSPSL